MKRALALGCLAAVACASSPAMRAAQGGGHAALGQAVAEREKRGDLSNGEAATLASAVADRELRVANPDKKVELVRDVRACARELDAALEYRMSFHDEAGAEAALERTESG